MYPIKRKIIRYKLLIYPRFQVTILLFNFFIVMGIFFLTNWRINAYFNHMKKLGEDASFPSDHIYFQFVSLQEAGLESSLMQIALVGLILSTLGFLILSHKISGPMIRLKRYFANITQTQRVSPITFRAGDFFSDLPALINGALDSITNHPSNHQEDDK